MNELVKTSLSDLERIANELAARLAGKVGVEGAARILENFMASTQKPIKMKLKIKLIRDYICAEAIGLFDLKEVSFLTSEVTEYRDARMACYHLIHSFTDESHAKIGESFNRDRDSVGYFLRKCDEILESPHYAGNRGFINKYDSLKRSAIGFIATLN